MVYRIRLIEPISADFAVLVGDAIRNLRSSLNQVAYQLAVQHSGPLTEDAERMTELPIRISGAQFDDWATSKNKQTKLRRSEVFGKRGSALAQLMQRIDDQGHDVVALTRAVTRTPLNDLPAQDLRYRLAAHLDLGVDPQRSSVDTRTDGTTTRPGPHRTAPAWSVAMRTPSR